MRGRRSGETQTDVCEVLGRVLSELGTMRLTEDSKSCSTMTTELGDRHHQRLQDREPLTEYLSLFRK